MYVYNFLFVPGARFKYHKMTTSESRAVSPRSLGQFIHSVLFIFTTRYLTSEPASFFSREACDTCEKPAEVSAIAFFDDVGRRGGWRKEGKGVRARSVHDLYPSYRGRALFLGSKRGVVVARYTFHGPIRSYVLRNAESGFIECSWKLQLHIYIPISFPLVLRQRLPTLETLSLLTAFSQCLRYYMLALLWEVSKSSGIRHGRAGADRE